MGLQNSTPTNNATNSTKVSVALVEKTIAEDAIGQETETTRNTDQTNQNNEDSLSATEKEIMTIRNEKEKTKTKHRYEPELESVEEEVNQTLDKINELSLQSLSRIKRDLQKAKLSSSCEINPDGGNADELDFKTSEQTEEPIQELLDKNKIEDQKLNDAETETNSEEILHITHKNEDQNAYSIMNQRYTIFKTDNPNHLKERILCHRLYGDQDKLYDEKGRIATEALDIFNGIHSQISKFISRGGHDTETYKYFLEQLDEILTQDVGPLDFPTDPQDRHRFKFGDEEFPLSCPKQHDGCPDPTVSATC